MGIIVNPFTGNFDFTGSGGGGGGGPAERYTNSFDATTSWGAPSGGNYAITILQVTHGRGSNPNVQIYELIGGVYQNIGLQIEINGVGDVTIRVNQTPDLRFAGIFLII